MELSKNYLPSVTEEKWIKHWRENGYFKSVPDNRTPFTIVIPPPNVTGVLHLGHTLNETVQDILIRRARMNGYNACWVPGSDHASIATEARVVKMLKERNIDKNDLTREEFLKYAFEWKEKYGNIIYQQIERLGCSVDWSRVTFTMDDHYYKAVIKVFVEMYDKGLIYRRARMINWDPAAKTALSDEEVEYKDLTGTLYYVKYPVVELQHGASIHPDESGHYIIIATQRPETIMGDVAVCVNPQDERYAKLKGKQVLVPLVNRAVPVIFDDYVDKEFGTGALKITPAHDIHDYHIGMKHNLPVIDTLNEDGTISEAAQVFVGLDRFEARKKAVEQLQREGLLIKTEQYATRLGYSQRSGSVVEPRISTQWFVQMKELSKPALDAVVNGDITIHPGDKFLATYKYWLENVKDWCISRQLWWGQQIPAWYDDKGNYFIAENLELAQRKYNQFVEEKKQSDPGYQAAELMQDKDVLDTWFSSWLWPIEVFKGISDPGNKEFKYYYPTSVLVTGQDIIFFWVTRMIIAGYEFEKQKPFNDVYFTGMVRDAQGRKMSKSLGNSPDLLDLIDKYGADAVRFGIMISSPAGNDLLFDEASLEQGRNFNNKLWNALKLVKMWESNKSDQNSGSNFATAWFDSRLSEARIEVEKLMRSFKLSEALKTIYSLIWDDFCSWYLEWVKPPYGEPIDKKILEKTTYFFEQLMQLLHPFMPFITEEIYEHLNENNRDLSLKQYDPVHSFNENILHEAELLKKVITSIRDARTKNQLKPKDQIKLSVETEETAQYDNLKSILAKQVNASEILFTKSPVQSAMLIAIEKDRFYIETEKKIDNAAQRDELLKDLQHQRGFLASVEKKLSNERFVQNARPDVVNLEKKKQSDALARIRTIEESLAQLNGS